MKRMLLTLRFDGTAYHGWQVQPNGITVQQVLQDALTKMLGGRPAVTGCSRTDAGVHANEFCCHLDCEDKIPTVAFLKGLNSILPDDIAIKDCREVESRFHARYDATGKEYVYHIFNSSEKNPFKLRYAWQVERSINLAAVNEFCSLMIGRHDFAAFSSSGRTVSDTVRTVERCFAVRDGDMIKLHIAADGFLYNMVRIFTGTAVEVSDKKITPADITRAFETGARQLTGITAPPQGLFLEKVFY